MYKIKQETKEVKKLKPVKDAYYEDVDLGKSRIVEYVDKKGKVTKVEEPVKQRVLHEAEYKEVTEKIDVYLIKDGEEIHEFATKEAAENFIREVKNA